jgi:2Fe-2S ferredoxin
MVAERETDTDALVNVTFRTPSGETRAIKAAVGTTLMEAAVANEVEGIIGECGGSCACATCHVRLPPEWFERVGPPGDMEVNTLYFRAHRQPTSRLACQIVLSCALDGLQADVATD